MPKSNRAGRKVQLRRLNYNYKCVPAAPETLLGVYTSPTITGTLIQGKIINAAPWVQAKHHPAPEIDGISEIPIPWRLILIDQ